MRLRRLSAENGRVLTAYPFAANAVTGRPARPRPGIHRRRLVPQNRTRAARVKWRASAPPWPPHGPCPPLLPPMARVRRFPLHAARPSERRRPLDQWTQRARVGQGARRARREAVKSAPGPGGARRWSAPRSATARLGRASAIEKSRVTPGAQTCAPRPANPSEICASRPANPGFVPTAEAAHAYPAQVPQDTAAIAHTRPPWPPPGSVTTVLVSPLRSIVSANLLRDSREGQPHPALPRAQQRWAKAAQRNKDEADGPRQPSGTRMKQMGQCSPAEQG
jgi:hypothetical protein